MAAASRRFFRLARGVEVATIRVTKEQALDAQFYLARNTPVDVGTARSNWRISVGRPHVGRVKAYFPYLSRHRKPFGSGGSITEGANLAGVIRQGQSRLAKYTRGPIYITNNLPYIGPLDRGHSPQSSSIVARAMLAATVKTSTKIPKIYTQEFSK